MLKERLSPADEAARDNEMREALDACPRILDLIKRQFAAGTSSDLNVAQQESLVEQIRAGRLAIDFRVHDLRVAAMPPFDVFRVADVDDAFADDGKRGRGRLPRFAGPDARIRHDQIGAGWLAGAARRQ